MTCVKKHKPKPIFSRATSHLKVGHEMCLSKVIAERRKVELLFNPEGDNTIVGEVLEFDKYSLRVRNEQGETFWFFKRAIIGFREID